MFGRRDRPMLLHGESAWQRLAAADDGRKRGDFPGTPDVVEKGNPPNVHVCV